MRLKLFFLSISIFTAIGLNAQYSGTKGRTLDFSGIDIERISVGIRLSPIISWVNVTHNDAEADGASLNYGLGAVVNYELNSILSVVSGINYQTFGGYAFDNKSLNDLTNKDNYKLRYSEIEIPLGLKIQTPTLGGRSYYITAGLSSGFILSANEKHISTVSNTKPTYYDIMSVSSFSRIGSFVGLGYNYQLGKKTTLFAEIAYKAALTNVANGTEYSNDGIHNYTQDIEILPSSMDFSIGLMF